MHTFSKSQFTGFLKEACRSARAVPGEEICGMIVDTGFHLSLVQVRNVSRRVGSFVLSRPDVRRIVIATRILEQEVVGTFHSHPAAPAAPGKSDITNAVDDSLMLIFDCTARCGRLWRIRGGRARELDFTTLPKKRFSEPGGSVVVATVASRAPGC